MMQCIEMTVLYMYVHDNCVKNLESCSLALILWQSVI